MKRFLLKAKQLRKCGFWVAGMGHFDISIEELATILKLMDKDDFTAIRKLYLKWSKERLP